MRGTKLTAWRIPPIWNDLRANVLTAPEGSSVPQTQRQLVSAIEKVLRAIAEDVRGGLLETVGVESRFGFDDDRCAMILELPAGADADLIARAIDAENVEAWLDADGRVCVGVSPWFSTKDVDQTVLSAIKVVHVLLGLHAGDAPPPKTLAQKLLAGVAEIMLIQKGAEKKKNQA